MARKQPVRDFSFSREMIKNDTSTPELLKKYREGAWEAFQKLSLPTNKEEDWRRTSLRGLDFGSLQLPNGTEKQDRSRMLETGVIPENVLKEKTAALITPNGVEISGGADLMKQGIVFSSLAEAAQEHPQLLEKILGKVVRPDEGKFAAAAGAFSDQGLFVYVPKGVEVKDSLFGIVFAPGGGSAYFFHILVYLEEGASLSYVQETLSPPDQDQASLTSENLEVYVGANAKLSVTELQSYGQQVWSFGHKKALVERDGYLEWDIGAL